MDTPIRVAIVHGGRLIREGLADLLGRNDIAVSGTFASVGSAESLPEAEDAVVLYDLGTAHQDGMAAIAAFQGAHPCARILFFNVVDDDAAIIECVQAGAAGCVLQDASLPELIAAVRSVCTGTPPESPRIITTLFRYVAQLRAGTESPVVEQLTAREQEVLALMVEGLSNKEIAERLVLQPQTVKNYAHTVLQKLGLRSRFDVMKMLRSGKRS